MSSELSVSETTLLRRPVSANSEDVLSSTALVPSSPSSILNKNHNNHKSLNTPVSSVAQLVGGNLINNNKIEVHLNHDNSYDDDDGDDDDDSNQQSSPIETTTFRRNMETNKRVFFRVGIDVLILLCVGFPILFFHLFGKPYERGFFCDDESLKHPFHESTVKTWMLYIVGIFLPIGTILTVEVIKSQNAARIGGNNSRSSYNLFGYDIPVWLAESYKQIGIFAFGAAVCQLTTDIAKYSIGRFRPHFFSVCEPRIWPNSTTCEDPINIGKYIMKFTCSNKDASKRLLKEMRLSFPSGHSSFTFYTMVFTALYLQYGMTWRGSRLLRHFLQFLFIMIAWYTALSRVSDYKHHWSDVLAGATLGALSALLVANFVSDMFQKKLKNSFLLPTTNQDLQNQTIALNGH